MKTVIVGDLHLRKEQPFLSAANKVLDIISESVSKGDRVIFLGDFFHTARPYPEEFKVANDFFHNCRAEEITILAGNHEYLQTRDSFSEYAFEKGLFRFIDSPVEVHDADCDYLFLPWVSSYRVTQMGFRDLRDYYENWLSKWSPMYSDPDRPLYVLYHFEDETVFAGVDELGVDLSVIEEKAEGKRVTRIGGHIHNPSASSNYLGTPYMTRKDDSSGERPFYYLEKEEGEDFHRVEIPSLIEYLYADYDDLKDITFDSGIFYILSVAGVPSSESLFDWKSCRPNVWIEDYTLRFGDSRAVLESTEEKAASIREYLKLFIKQNRVDKDTANYLLSIF